MIRFASNCLRLLAQPPRVDTRVKAVIACVAPSVLLLHPRTTPFFLKATEKWSDGFDEETREIDNLLDCIAACRSTARNAIEYCRIFQNSKDPTEDEKALVFLARKKLTEIGSFLDEQGSKNKSLFFLRENQLVGLTWYNSLPNDFEKKLRETFSPHGSHFNLRHRETNHYYRYFYNQHLNEAIIQPYARSKTSVAMLKDVLSIAERMLESEYDVFREIHRKTFTYANDAKRFERQATNFLFYTSLALIAFSPRKWLLFSGVTLCYANLVKGSVFKKFKKPTVRPIINAVLRRYDIRVLVGIV